MIYAIHAIGTDFVKFGKAAKPENRLALLQCGCPLELVLIANADWPEAEEFIIHEYLKNFRVRGEWFKRGVEQVSHVIDLLRDDEGLSWFQRATRSLRLSRDTQVSESDLFKRRLGKALKVVHG